MKTKEKGRFTFVTIRLRFNNTAMATEMKIRDSIKSLNVFLPVDSVSFLKMFPFYVAFDKNMVVNSFNHYTFLIYAFFIDNFLLLCTPTAFTRFMASLSEELRTV